MSNSLLIIVIVAPALLWLAWTWNRLVAMRAMLRAAWASVDVLLKRRSDLVPQLVTVVKGAMNYETDLLGNPAKWVPYEGPNQLNTTSKIVQIKDGKFVTISDWVQWPPKS